MKETQSFTHRLAPSRPCCHLLLPNTYSLTPHVLLFVISRFVLYLLFSFFFLGFELYLVRFSLSLLFILLHRYSFPTGLIFLHIYSSQDIPPHSTTLFHIYPSTSNSLNHRHHHDHKQTHRRSIPRTTTSTHTRKKMRTGTPHFTSHTQHLTRHATLPHSLRHHTLPRLVKHFQHRHTYGTTFHTQIESTLRSTFF